MLDAVFLDAVAPLHHPRMGTELMGPLLYSLVRSTRPERVLEVGGGATSLYLLRALADNAADVERERRQLRAKQNAYDRGWEDETLAAQHRGDVLAWLERPPALGLPDYYERVRSGRLTSVDKRSSPYTTAGGANDVARALGLDSWLTTVDCDFREVDRVLADSDHIDFAWFDCGGYQDYRDFIDLYWDRIDDDGGLLLLHYTLTVPNHERILAELASEREQRGAFEMLSLVEPHKLMQNSVTLVRRCTRPVPRYPVTRPISLERDS